jgi:hypothetical protein
MHGSVVQTSFFAAKSPSATVETFSPRKMKFERLTPAAAGAWSGERELNRLRRNLKP